MQTSVFTFCKKGVRFPSHFTSAVLLDLDTCGGCLGAGLLERKKIANGYLNCWYFSRPVLA